MFICYRRETAEFDISFDPVAPRMLGLQVYDSDPISFALSLPGQYVNFASIANHGSPRKTLR